MTPTAVHHIFATFERLNPTPVGELNYTNLYTLLVAVVLSAQATDKSVNKATATLFDHIATPADMLAFGEANLLAAIRSIGLANTKAANVIKLSQQLIDQHHGNVPNDQKALEALSGVGRKTANVVRNIGFGEPTIAVDTHLFRVSNRTGLASGNTVLAVEKALNQIIPPDYLLHAHHWLILHGRYICTARKPNCAACPIQQWCNFADKNL